MIGNPSRTARYTATLVSGIYAVVLYLAGLHLQQGVRQALAYVPALIGLGIVAFDTTIWKWTGVHQLVSRPRLDGAWTATLTPNRESHIPPGGNRGPIHAAVLIDQTYWTVSITLLTKESASWSTTATLRRVGSSRSRNSLTYVYANEPKQENRPRSNPHGGATSLEVAGNAPTHMVGTYWTDRLTVGDMELHLLGRARDFADLASVDLAYGLSEAS